jgi:carbonic anhydrase
MDTAMRRTGRKEMTMQVARIGRWMVVGLAGVALAVPALAAEPSAPTPADALARLKAGNARFVAGTGDTVPIGAPRRSELVAGQHPFAIVLSCADSRVPPEHVFNVGLGDLFVVRTAGEVTDRAVLASVEYAAEHLHVPLLVVMGHGACGAVKAASEPHSESLGPNLEYLVNAIHPAVEHAQAVPTDARLKAAILSNVEQVINDTLSKSSILNDAVEQGHLQVVGAFYDLGPGTVTFTRPITAASLAPQQASR